MTYITARIQADRVFHGYDENREIVVTAAPEREFVEKVIRLDRILSITEDYIFIECPHDTVQTWRYEGGLEGIKRQLQAAGLLVG